MALASTPPRAPQRGVFDRVAETASDHVGRAWFFASAIALVVLWLPTGLAFHSADTWQLVISTITSVSAFLLIALLQNAVRRNDLAVHRKLDLLASALAGVLRDPPPTAEDRDRNAQQLEDAVGLEERI